MTTKRTPMDTLRMLGECVQLSAEIVIVLLACGIDWLLGRHTPRHTPDGQSLKHEDTKRR